MMVRAGSATKLFLCGWHAVAVHSVINVKFWWMNFIHVVVFFFLLVLISQTPLSSPSLFVTAVLDQYFVVWNEKENVCGCACVKRRALMFTDWSPVFTSQVECPSHSLPSTLVKLRYCHFFCGTSMFGDMSWSHYLTGHCKPWIPCNRKTQMLPKRNFSCQDLVHITSVT